MPSDDSTDSADSLGREQAPIDEYLETGPSPTLVVAFGLSVMAFVTFVAMNQLPNTDYGDGGFVAFVLTIPFFFGAYAAVHGFFGGLETVTAADD
jgi:hypothetical protein